MKSVAKLSAVALIASLALVGCSSVDAGDPVDAVAKTSAPVASPAPETTPAAPKDTIAKFGQSFVYADKLTVTVTPNGPAVASASAAGAESTGGEIYLFTIEIQNGSDAIFDPAMFRAEINYGADGTAGNRVFDSANGIGDQFQGRILPGKKQAVQFAYAIPAAELTDVLMIVSPSFNHIEQLFSGPLS